MSTKLEPGRLVRPERREGYVVRSHWTNRFDVLWFLLMRALGRRPVPWSPANQEVAP